jgi:hypothetical protein
VSRCGVSAPYSTGTAEKSVEKSRAKFIRCAHVRRARARGTTANVPFSRVSTKPARPSDFGVTSLSTEKSTTPILHRGRPIVSTGRATDSYEFGWHPVLNKSRTRTLSGHKIYGAPRKTCKRTAEFYFGKNSLPARTARRANLFAEFRSP